MATARPKQNTATGNRWDMSRWEAGKVTILQAMGLPWKVTYPKLTPGLTDQAKQIVNSKGAAKAAGKSVPANITTGGATGMRGLYNALRSAGATKNQAIGMIANAINESSLNPEARVMDSNGYYSNGLWQFNEASYPDAGSLVTGNPAKDMIAQIQYLFRVGGLAASTGSTPEQAAGNFSDRFENCQGCQPGGAQYNQRVGNVADVLKELGL